MAYNCVITTLQNIRPIPKADNIVLASASGYQVIVSKNSKVGEIVALFVDDGCLSKDYLKANNLVGYVDSNGVKQGGFFSENGRVKAQKFRGEKSEAYVASLESFKFTGYDINKLSIGDAFNQLNNIPICEKYFTPSTKKAKEQNKKKSSKKINEELKKLFPEHKDTEQFRFAQDYNLQGLVTITSKLHGTSARTGNILYPKEYEIKNPFKRLWNVIVDEVLHGKRHLLNFWTDDVKASKLKFYPEVIHSWEIIYGTRRVIKGIVDPTAQDYRSLSASKLAPFIEKGEVWYYEIVGYEDNGASIMQSIQTKDMGKEFVKRFGNTMTYKYGCLQGTWDIYVYRITTQNSDGVIYELPWASVKAKCNNSGIKHVPELATYIVNTDFEANQLKQEVEYWTEEVDIADPIDNSHIREGICIRIDNLETSKSTIWKNKTFAFKCGEGILKNSEDYVDTEEVEG